MACYSFWLKRNTDEEYKQRHQWMEETIYRYFQSSRTIRKRGAEYVLPVVVHIIHNNGPENITDEEVERGIDNLNKAFANIGYYDRNTGTDTRIQFCLAKQDPEGNLTSGINRVRSYLTKFNYILDDQTLKNLIRWDPTRYINIWLVSDICNSTGCNVIGYATFPTRHGKSDDGIVIEAAYVAGSESDAATLVHEMGHYLGLYHTFQGGCKNDDCYQDGDRICDTPPDESVFEGSCMSGFNSCTTDTQSGFTTDQMDMNWNYMDYVQRMYTTMSLSDTRSLCPSRHALYWRRSGFHQSIRQCHSV